MGHGGEQGVDDGVVAPECSFESSLHRAVDQQQCLEDHLVLVAEIMGDGTGGDVGPSSDPLHGDGLDPVLGDDGGSGRSDRGTSLGAVDDLWHITLP